MRGSFNPLHCGAVVASHCNGRSPIQPVKFQSPSLRGSGRFYPIPSSWMSSARFNPLHCGAVVASYKLDRSPIINKFRFNPLHCGAVVASRRGVRQRPRAAPCFNPLHCGAVVASLTELDRAGKTPPPFQSPSLRGSGRFWQARIPSGSGPSRFNPLHCGAVVASTRGDFNASPPGGFQSPSLRGSGRFTALLGERGSVVVAFQSPSLRGSGRFRGPRRSVSERGRVSIPFIAGQWSLPTLSSALTSPR